MAIEMVKENPQLPDQIKEVQKLVPADGHHERILFASRARGGDGGRMEQAIQSQGWTSAHNEVLPDGDAVDAMERDDRALRRALPGKMWLAWLQH